MKVQCNKAKECTECQLKHCQSHRKCVECDTVCVWYEGEGEARCVPVEEK